MKKNILLALSAVTCLSGVAQNKAQKTAAHILKPAPRTSFLKKENIMAKPVQNNNIPYSPLASNVSAFTWTNISNCMNVYGVLTDGQKPLHYNPYVNAVSFIHRKGPDFVASPDNNSGAIVAEISTNWGATWDSTCIYSDGVNLARYPQGAIYSAPGNTNIANAYVVGSGIVTDGTNWIGSWFASKQLGAGNYNGGASTVPNAMQIMPNYAPYGTAGKDDYSCYSFASTNDGKVRSMGFYADDINNAPGDIRGFKINTGTFNAGVFNWTGDSILPPCVKRNDSTKQIGYTPVMAWSQDGTIGYAVALGARIGATGPNRGYQPIVYKTTNSGASWALLSGIDFSQPTYSTVLNRLSPVTNSTIVVPQFIDYEGIDATVDVNGKLHIGVTVIGTASLDNDSLDNYNSFTSEDYRWPHTPGQQPYLYDFYGDGTSAWEYLTIDSITSECPSDQSGYPGYNDNPWDDQGGKVRSGSRIQLSRTPDGKFIIYTWAESNPAFTIGGKFWNTMPDLKQRIVDVTNVGGQGAYAVAPAKMALTPVGTPVNGKAMFHFVAPVVSAQTYTSSNTVTFTVPITVTNSNPYSQLTTNTNWYTSAKVDYALSTVGIKENSAGIISNCSIFPNPAKNNATLTFEMKESSTVNVVIYDVVGKAVRSVSGNCIFGSNSIALGLENLTSGIYMVNVKAGNTVSTKKLIIE